MTARKAPRRKGFYDALALLAHLFLALAILGVATTLSEQVLAVLAAELLVAVMLAITLVYVRNFGEERPGTVREGYVGLGRGFLLFFAWATMSYLVFLLLIGPALGPTGFTESLAVFFALVVLFMIAVRSWVRQNRRRSRGAFR